MDKYTKNWKKIKNSSSFHRKIKRNFNKIIAVELSNNNVKTNIPYASNYFAPTPTLVSSDENINCAKNMRWCDDSQPFSTTGFLEPNSDNSDDKISSSDSEDDASLKDIESISKKLKFRQDLKVWAILFNIKQNALKELLKLLNTVFPNMLPVDPRTLLQTPSIINTIINSDSKDSSYWHQGLEFCLKQTFRSLETPININININIDGLPIFKSSKEEFWPILYNIHEYPHIAPMVIGIYSGKGKPKDIASFIKPFVEEAKHILENGIEINENKISVKIRCFICDSPARAFIKGVANFNGQHGCQKCTIVGQYSDISRCNIFPSINNKARTDKDFRAKVYEDHHKYYSPLEELPFLDMVKDFVIADSLHLLDLGIMKRCLFGWRDGTFRNNHRTKWSSRVSQSITKWLLTCKMPSELHRAIRGLDCMSHWKALEYRTFLYYLGIVLLKHVLPNDAYEHFLLFFCAVTICSSNIYTKHLNVAQEMFSQYVKLFIEIYGEQYVTSNVHNLCHVVDDVKQFGILSSISAYPFENKLYQIKKMLRTSTCALSQVAKRTTEFMIIATDKILEKPKTNYLKNKANKVEVILEHFSLKTESKNQWFLTKENEIVAMKNATEENGIIYISGSSLQNQEDFFEYPLLSSHINVFKSNCIENMEKLYTLNEVKCKMIKVSYENDTVFIPLLHTIIQ